MRESIRKIVAAQHLREMLCSNFVGDLIHDTRDCDVLDLALKLTKRLGELARTDEDEAKK